jgi:hypothetical protein
MGPNKPDFNECAAQFIGSMSGQHPVSRLAHLLDEMYERGFSDGRDAYGDDKGPPDRPCHCGNCGGLFMERQLRCNLEEIPDLGQRLDPGGEVPVGECPECGALAYLVKKGDYRRLDVDWLAENVARVMAKQYGDGTSDCRSYVMDMLLGDDPHTAVAAFMFGKKPVELTQIDRDKAKTELFKLCYGGV